MLKDLPLAHEKELYKKLSGQSQWTILSEFPDYDLTAGIAYEFMHAFLFGVVGSITKALFGPPKTIPSQFSIGFPSPRQLPSIVLDDQISTDGTLLEELWDETIPFSPITAETLTETRARHQAEKLTGIPHHPTYLLPIPGFFTFKKNTLKLI